MSPPSPGERRSPRRRYLGSASGFDFRQRVYATREALEVDEIEGYDVTRRRVFYDDVLLVTRHRYFGWPFLVMTGLATVLFAWLTAVVGAGDPRSGAIFFAFTGLPFALAFLLRLALRVDAITVYGRRTRARLQFGPRKDRAQRAFDQICRSVRQAQGPIAPASRIAAPAAPPPP